MTPSLLQAGAAQVDITPLGPVHLAGAVGEYRPAELVADPLYASALVLEQGGRKLCILSLDITIITEPYTARIREAVADRCGIESDAIMVHATQTHSAPPIGHFMVDEDFAGIPDEREWIKGGEDAYSDWAADRAIEAACLAHGSLRPVTIAYGRAIEGRMAHNRRAVGRDGTVFMPPPSWQHWGPLGPTKIAYIDGPIDPEVGVICLRSEQMRIMAVVANYACHPVHVFPRRIVSADWPGALRDDLQRVYGPQCVPLILNGPCGNINPWAPFDPDYVPDHRRMGAVLASAVTKVVEALACEGAFSHEAALDWRVEHEPLPLRELSPEELSWCQRVLAQNPQPLWTEESKVRVDPDWMAAASVYSVQLMRQRSAELPYEVQVLRIGDAAIVGLPGEPFVEGGLRIKLASPATYTHIAHCTTHYVGYLPTKESLARGGHEVNTRFWAKLTPDALDRVVGRAAAVLGKVFTGC